MQLLSTPLYDIRWMWLINRSSRYLPSSALQGTLEALLFTSKLRLQNLICIFLLGKAVL